MYRTGPVVNNWRQLMLPGKGKAVGSIEALEVAPMTRRDENIAWNQSKFGRSKYFIWDNKMIQFQPYSVPIQTTIVNIKAV